MVLPACTGEFFAAALKHYDIISVFALCHQAVTIIAVHMLDFLSIAHYTFFAGTGLNLGYNLSGKLDAHDDPTENYDFEFGSDKNFTRADLGLNFLIGYQTKSGIFVSANSLVSLTDIAPTAISWKNNVISLSVGYTLKSSKK